MIWRYGGKFDRGASGLRQRRQHSISGQEIGSEGELDTAEMAERYGGEMTVLDWAARPVFGKCGSRRVSMVVSETEWQRLTTEVRLAGDGKPPD